MTDPEDGEIEEQCDYCWEEATHERSLPGDGRYVYCPAHAPEDADPIPLDADGQRLRWPESD